LSVRYSNNKYIEENKDEYLDQREQAVKERENFFLGLYRLRPTDPYFSHNLPVEQQIKFALYWEFINDCNVMEIAFIIIIDRKQRFQFSVNAGVKGVKKAKNPLTTI